MQKMIVLAICLGLSACSSLMSVNYKIGTNVEMSHQRVLPVKIQSIQADVDERFAYQIVPHCHRDYRGCNFSKPAAEQKTQVDIYSDMKQALQIALQDAFTRTKLFAEQSDRLVNVKATFVELHSKNAVLSRARTTIFYQFFNARTGELIYQTHISSMGNQFEVANIVLNSGFGENTARNDAVSNNIQKLLRELSDEKKNAPFFRQPEN